MKQEYKIKIGMVQMNNSFMNQTYFPYSLGFLQAYSQKHLKNIDDFEFLPSIFKRISIKDAVNRLSSADIVFFSVYVWNFKLSSAVAKKLKEINPGILIVFGGCHVPENGIEVFLKENSFIDIACYGEGEKVFKSILESYKDKAWNNVPSISYIDQSGKVVRNPDAERISNLDKVPSPYLSGVFDKLIEENPGAEWLGLWETNRGCPFGCSYCEWGGDYQKRLNVHSLERVFEEIDWFSRNKIEFIFCCDANFGILDRDLDIVKRVAGNKKKYGYPKVLSVQNTKNSTDKSYEIQKVMSDAGLNKGVNLAIQSLNEETLASIGRKNIPVETFFDLQKRFYLAGIETFSDLILGLPKETYGTFADGVVRMIENGQHNRIQFNNLSVLPNSEMAHPEYKEKYGIITKEAKTINIHGTLDSEEEVCETQELVVGTDSMPKEDWVKTRVFSWMVSFLYFDKILQIPLAILHKSYSISFREMVEAFMEKDDSFPVISEINRLFFDKALDIQKGGPEYCQSEKWLNIWWPPDELSLIKLCTEDKLDDFYSEAERKIEGLLEKRGIRLEQGLLKDAIRLNKKMIKLPFQEEDCRVELSFNIFDVYHSILEGTPINIEKGKYVYSVDRKSKKWPSWEDWCKSVVWYENKKGAYLYPCYAA